MLQVAIIGGGLAGSVLALCLHKRGISCAVYETRPDTPSTSVLSREGNLALAPNALRVLDRLGLYETLRPQGFNYDEIAFLNRNCVELGRFLNGSVERYNFRALRIQRGIVRRELTQRVIEAGIPIHWSKKCVGVVSETVEKGGSATVKFTDGETVTARFIIGADGIHSLVRPFITANSEPVYSGIMGIGGTVQSKDLGALGETKGGLHLPCMMIGENGSFAIMPTSYDGEQLGFFTTFEAEDRGREDWTRLQNNPSEMKSILEEKYVPSSQDGLEWSEMVQKLCGNVTLESLKSWPYYSVPALDSWTSPLKRVILIGDAAHAIPPTGGQGAAMAFEDADTISYVLARAFTTEFDQIDPQTVLLKSWQRHRMERIAKITAFTTRGTNLRKGNLTWGEQMIKEWALWTMFKMKGSEFGASWMYSYSPEEILAGIA